MTSDMKRYAAEMVGTFVLVFFGIGTAAISGDKVGALGVGVAFGLALLVMCYVIGPISGCHINPAVTIGLLFSKRFESKHVPGYLLAQLVGGILGAGLVLLIIQGKLPYEVNTMAGVSNGYGDHSPSRYGMMSAFLAETALTGLLVLTVLGSTDVKAPAGFAGIAIGLVLVAIHLVGIPITNLSANPVRSIATAIFAGRDNLWALQQLWLFIVAPIVGGIFAAIVYSVIRLPA